MAAKQTSQLAAEQKKQNSPNAAHQLTALFLFNQLPIPDPEKAIKTFHEKGPNFQFPDFGMAGKMEKINVNQAFGS